LQPFTGYMLSALTTATACSWLLGSRAVVRFCLASEQFVDFKLPSGRVQANGVEIEDSGEVVRFTRGVIFDVDAEAPEAKK